MIQIKDRYSGKILWEGDAENLRDAVIKAVKEGANLSGAYLGESNLSGAFLGEAHLRGADLRGANLRGADLSEANLNGAYLSEAYLRGADLSGANLSEAYLGEAHLRGANLRGADLRGADLSGANLDEIKKDFYDVLSWAKDEVVGLYKYLIDGRINGSTYSGECACLIGTIAKVRHVSVDILEKNSQRPIERWFLAIQKGDTPENNPVSAIVKDWLHEFASEHNIALPTRKIVWSDEELEE